MAALRNQEAELNQMRTHTGTLLAAGSVATSFLGSQVLGSAGSGSWGAMAVIAFVLSIVLCIYLLIPKRGLVFALKGSVLEEKFAGSGKSEEQIYATLASWLTVYHTRNQRQIDRLTRFFAVASIALVAEIFLFVMALQATI